MKSKQNDGRFSRIVTSKEAFLINARNFPTRALFTFFCTLRLNSYEHHVIQGKLIAFHQKYSESVGIEDI